MPPSSEQDKRQRGRDLPGSAPPEPDLRFTLPVDWVSPSLARDRLKVWLLRHRWSPAQIDDLVLVVNEAVTNSVEHGYGLSAEHESLPSATVEVVCRVLTDPAGHRQVEITVRDHGRWRPPGAPGSRGRGISLIRACGEHVAIDHDDAGTTVVVLSHPVPPMPGPR